FGQAYRPDNLDTQRRLKVLEPFFQKLLAQRLNKGREPIFQSLHLSVDAVVPLLPAGAFATRAHLDDAILRLRPALLVVDREEGGLQAVILLVTDRLELVPMAAGTLNRESQ